MQGSKKAVPVVGAGNATGGAVARRFAREGYVACVTRRSEAKPAPLVQQIRAAGGEAHGFGSDARKEVEMVALVQKIEAEIAPIEVAVFNIGANVRFGIAETFIRSKFPERYALKGQDGIVNPEHIADVYWYLHTQPRDAWTHELEIRPWMEAW